MTWVQGLIRTTNRVSRALHSGGKIDVPLEAQAAATRELCNRYWSLLLDTSFRRDIEDAPRKHGSENAHKKRQLHFDDDELDRHFDRAIALLVEVGTDAEIAIEAIALVRSRIKEPNLAHPQHVFQALLEAKRLVCELADDLSVEATTVRRRKRLQKLGIASVGLVLIGVTGGAFAGATAIAAGVGAAAMAAIGGAIFQIGVDEARQLED